MFFIIIIMFITVITAISIIFMDIEIIISVDYRTWSNIMFIAVITAINIIFMNIEIIISVDYRTWSNDDECKERVLTSARSEQQQNNDNNDNDNLTCCDQTAALELVCTSWLRRND